MTSGQTAIRRRLVLCVDGTFQREDGSIGGRGNQTNIFRVFASVKKGNCVDEATGTTYLQEPVYIEGLGSRWDVNKLAKGALGLGITDLIQKTYEHCCKLEEEDEIWLYGFSRGAFVIRAVAGMLHHVGVMTSLGADFRKHFRKMLDQYKLLRQGQVNSRPGKTHRFLTTNMRAAPRIRFIGAFDTVKMAKDDDLHDIDFNSSVQHMRHALALHEERVFYKPKYASWSNHQHAEIVSGAGSRSFIQAWFVGSHSDMGGANHADGLSLYPLQWMLSESKSCGLFLGFNHLTRDVVDNPLDLVFPQDREEYTFTALNTMKICMHDMRSVHDDDDKYDCRYHLKLNSHRGGSSNRRTRTTFDSSGELVDYSQQAPHGTIIHPSVYFLLFGGFALTVLDGVEVELENHILKCERAMLGTVEGPSGKVKMTDPGFWNDGKCDDVALADDFQIRILVCGNAGAGKSTLINRVLGVDQTKISEREPGEHDIFHEFTWKDQPHLVVHDSKGFENGKEEQMRLVESFLKAKSKEVQLSKRLHMICPADGEYLQRFCAEVGNNRFQQSSTKGLFEIVSRHAAAVPLIVVMTQKDVYYQQQFGKKSMELIRQGQHDANFAENCQAFATESLNERIDLMKAELQTMVGDDSDIPAGNCVAVSKDDQSSIERLTKETFASINSDRIRRLWVGAQVCCVDMKIALTLWEVTQRYKGIQGAAMACGFVPSTISSSYQCCKRIVKFFGLASVDFDEVFAIMKMSVWNDLGNGLLNALTDGLKVITGAPKTIAGLAVIIGSGIEKIPFMFPATSRTYLILACDLIIVLARSFQEALKGQLGQPTAAILSTFARQYRRSGLSKKVHTRIKRLAPHRNVYRSFNIVEIGMGIRKIVRECGVEFLEFREDQMQHFDINDDDVESDGDIVDYIAELMALNRVFVAARDILR